MSVTLYPHAVAVDQRLFLGRHADVTMFGAVGDGVTDDRAAFQYAVDDVAAAGGGSVLVPGGQTFALADYVSLPSNVRLHGVNGASQIIRIGTVSAGKGLLNVVGSGVEIEGISIDGAVTTPTGLRYGADFVGAGGDDPMHASLVANTSIRVQTGVRDFRLSRVAVRHTGGYAVLMDGAIEGVTIAECLFEYNRPHLFGTSVGDLNYGSWTGGVHYQGDGSSYALKDLLVQGCTFRRNTGNCVWGHAYALGKMHEGIRVVGCRFVDCGLDGVLIQVSQGVVVEGNTFRRIGYVATSDGGTALPKYLVNKYAVALDTGGLVKGALYKGNSFVSCYGGMIDADGLGSSAVVDNVGYVPEVGEAEYSEDLIALWSYQAYGCQPSNTNDHADAARHLIVKNNTFRNAGAGALRLYATRDSHVSGNRVQHPVGAVTAPVVVGPLSASANHRAKENVIEGNSIAWEPLSAAACIREDGSIAAFSAGEKNWVVGNLVQNSNGNAFEFERNSNSGSSTALVLSTGATVASRNQAIVQREGSGTAAVTRLYRQTSGAAAITAQFIDSGPVLNVSNDGIAGTGGLTTGNRTTLGILDGVFTGKLSGDAFLVMAADTYAAAEANAFDANHGLIRWNNTSKVFEQSVSVSAGARVWTALGGGGLTSINSQVGPAITISPGTGIGVSTPSSNTIQIANTGVLSVGGVAGSIVLGAGLAMFGSNLYSTGVLSIGGVGGAVSLGAGLQMSGVTLSNSGVLSLGGVSGAISVGQGLQMAGSVLQCPAINAGNVFVGSGVDVGVNGVRAAGFNASLGAGTFFGITGTQTYDDGFGNQRTLYFQGGICHRFN